MPRSSRWAPPLESTGSVPTRRVLLKALALAPVGALVLPTRPAEATDYAGPEQVFEAIDRLEADVAARLDAIARALPSAQAFAGSVQVEQRRQRAERGNLRRRLGLSEVQRRDAAPSTDTSLEGLRAGQEALVYAHAEGLPALGDPFCVDVLAHQMVQNSRILTVIQLWIESEGQRD